MRSVIVLHTAGAGVNGWRGTLASGPRLLPVGEECRCRSLTRPSLRRYPLFLPAAVISLTGSNTL